MRLKLSQGKQRELLIRAKDKGTWTALAAELGVSRASVNAWREEKNLLPGDIFDKLDKFSFRCHIMERKPDFWGQREGGLRSSGSTKQVRLPSHSAGLAEFVGCVLGDGNIFRDEQSGIYTVRIVGDARRDRDYLLNVITPLGRRLFGVSPHVHRVDNALYITFQARRLVDFFGRMGLNPGDKIRNQLTIPRWIMRKDIYLRACVRGLFDTDGSIYEVSKGHIQWSFKSNNRTLLKDMRSALITLGFTVSQVSRNQVYISRQEEVDKFYKQVQFSNLKHKARYARFRQPRRLAVKSNPRKVGDYG